jgi:hypothetical protein
VEGCLVDEYSGAVRLAKSVGRAKSVHPQEYEEYIARGRQLDRGKSPALFAGIGAIPLDSCARCFV